MLYSVTAVAAYLRCFLISQWLADAQPLVISFIRAAGGLGCRRFDQEKEE
jgi:hypothetical protein